MSPFFSIIIPTYNRAHFLPKAIESVINQTFTDWELVIVDDGSTDNTCQVVESFLSDCRIRYLYQHNQERCVARNNGINAAIANWICFLDSDDYYIENRLSLIKNSINDNKIALYFTGYCIKNENEFTVSEIHFDESNTYEYLLTNMVHSQQCCIHKSILRDNQFDPRFIVAEDLELWLRITNNYPIVYLPGQETVIVVEHENRTVGIGKLKPYLEHKKTLKHIVNLNYPVDKRLLNRLMHGVTMSIARCYIYKEKDRLKAIQYILHTIKYNFRDSIKEKIYILLRAIKPSLTKK